MELADPSVGAHRGIGRVGVMDLGLGVARAAEAVSLVSLGSGESELIDPDGASFGVTDLGVLERNQSVARWGEFRVVDPGVWSIAGWGEFGVTNLGVWSAVGA